MEPDHLKNTPPDDTALETWLRGNAALPPLPDDGFSQRVLTALPPPAKPQLPVRTFVCLTGGLAGMGAALIPLFRAEEMLAPVRPEVTPPFAAFPDAAISFAVAVTLATLAYVFWRDVRRLVGW